MCERHSGALMFEANGSGGIVMLAMTESNSFSKSKCNNSSASSCPSTRATAEPDATVELLCTLLRSHGGTMTAGQCCSSLYQAHPSCKAAVKAAGGMRALCAKHKQLQYRGSSGGGDEISVMISREPSSADEATTPVMQKKVWGTQQGTTGSAPAATKLSPPRKDTVIMENLGMSALTNDELVALGTDLNRKVKSHQNFARDYYQVRHNSKAKKQLPIGTLTLRKSSGPRMVAIDIETVTVADNPRCPARISLVVLAGDRGKLDVILDEYVLPP